MIYITTRKETEKILEWIKKNTSVIVMNDPKIFISTPLENIKSENIQLSYDAILHRLFMYDENERLNTQCVRCNNKDAFLQTIRHGFLQEWAK